MPAISTLQPFVTLRKSAQASHFDLLLRWVPEIFSWLPGKDDVFRLTIKIRYVGGPTKYLNNDGTIVAAEPTGADVPVVRPDAKFMLDPRRLKTLMPFVVDPNSEPNRFWFQGFRPLHDVECDISMTGNFPSETEGFGVCHLLTASQPSSAAYRIRLQAMPMIEASLTAFQKHGGVLTLLSSDPFEVLVESLAESIAMYLVRRTFIDDESVPKAIVPAINAGLAELAEVLEARKRNNGLGSTSTIPWRQPIFDYLKLGDRGDPTSIRYANSTGSHAEQIEKRYSYAAIVTNCLQSNDNWRALHREAKDAEQTRNQIRLRALHGGRLIDYSNDDAAGWKGQVRNSPEIIGLGRTFAGFPESEVANWAGVDLTVEHVPGAINLADNIPLADIQTFAVKKSVPAAPPPGGLLKRWGHGRQENGTETTEIAIAAQLETAAFILPRTAILAALSGGMSNEPTPPYSRDDAGGDLPIPRINYDLMQSDVKQPTQTLDQADQPPSSHVGFNTGDGKLEVLMSFNTDGTDTIRSSGGFNVYMMWQPENASPLSKYFESWESSGTLKSNWLIPPIETIRPYLVTRRYSYLRDLRESLKSLGGTVPENLVRNLMANPPKQTLFPRADHVSDKIEEETPRGGPKANAAGQDQDVIKMPNVVNQDTVNGKEGVLLHAWSGDLRKGMKSVDLQPNEKPEFLIPWDPAGGIDFNWTPQRTRTRPDRNGHLSTPQPYRVWITTTDFFDQESDPVPVYCHDSASAAPAEEYEKWLFRPVRRAPIEEPRHRRLDIVEVTARTAYDLTISWSTPEYNSTASGPDRTVAPELPDRDDLICYVALFRKMIQDREDAPPIRTLAGQDLTIPPFPQWEAARDALIAAKQDGEWEGWEQFGNHYEIDGAAMSSDSWSLTVPLDHTDRGYDYVALVGAQVKDGSTTAAFMAPNILNGGRRVQTVRWDPQTSEYVLVNLAMNETPRLSGAARTTTERLPNAEEPRGVVLSPDCPFEAALPVPPPAAIQRDLVLTKLLTHKVNAPNRRWPYRCDATLSPTPEENDWSDAADLNPAQIAMLESALSRTVGGGDICDPRYVATRRLLAQDLRHLKTTSEQTRAGYRQHPTVGFRGLKYLNWTYSSLKLSGTATVDEAEAVLVRVWQVRVETDPRQAASYASVQGTPTLTPLGNGNYTCLLRPSVGRSDLKGLQDIVCQQQPALVRIEPDGNSDGRMAWYGNVTEVVSFAPANACAVRNSSDPAIPIVSATIRLAMSEMPAGFPLGGALTARLYVAQPLTAVDQKISFKDPVVRQQLAVPVGGGPSECFAWWIGTISAKTREAGHGRRAFVIQQMAPSIEPVSPQDVRLAVPTNSSEHVINPADDAQERWLPLHLRNNHELVKITPNTVLTWRPYEPADRVGIILQRECRRVEPPSTRLRARTLDAWQAIKNIESAPDDVPLEKAWIDLLAGLNGWLLGKPVAQTGRDDTASLPDFILAAPNDDDLFLSGATGIKPIDPPATTEVLSHASFLDYNRENSRQLPITVDFECRYELTPYLDLGPELGPYRFLKGKPSGVTHWQRPENTPISVVEISRTASAPVDWNAGPFVRFEFEHDLQGMRLLNQLNDPTSWRYRIVVRRRLPYSLKSAATDAPAVGWEDVGNVLSMWPESTMESVTDFNIERIHPDWSVQDLQYQIVVQQFAVFENMEERPVRKQDTKRGTILSNDPLLEPAYESVAVVVPADDLHELGSVVRFRIT